MRHISILFSYLFLSGALIALSGQTATFTVPASANVALAGQSPGTQFGFDSAPLNSPVQVRLPVVAGDEFVFEVTGATGSAAFSAPASTPPDGDSMQGYTGGSFGISQIYGPEFSLVGVFVGDSVDRQLSAPALRFTGALMTLASYAPLLQQPFFIGDGKAGAGIQQVFVAPAGATRLYLGILTNSTTYAKGGFQVNASISNVRGHFAQVVDGGGWRTTILLYNTTRSESSYKLQMYRDDGTAMPAALSASSAPLEGTIASGGSATIETAGQTGSVTQGWALLSGTPGISGVGVFRQRIEGRPDQEASVISSGRERRLLVPYDQMEGNSTGLAITNPEGAQQTVSLTFRDERGMTTGRPALILPPNGHTAFALGTAQAPSGAPGTGRGVIEINGGSGQRVVALGLRFNATGAFTSLPVSVGE